MFTNPEFIGLLVDLLAIYFVVQVVLSAAAVLFYVFPRAKRPEDLEN